MTNELPEVGKRYKRKGYEFFIIEVHRIVKDSMGTLIVTKCERVYDLPNFFELFKKIPDHIPDIRKKVEEAKEELRDFLNLKEDLTLYPDYEKEQIERLNNYFWRLYGKAENLLNAIDDQNKKKRIEALRDKIGSGKVYFPQETPYIAIDSGKDGGCEMTFTKDDKGNIHVKDIKHTEPVCDYYDNIHYQNFSAELVNYLGHILSQQEENTKRIEKLEKLLK